MAFSIVIKTSQTSRRKRSNKRKHWGREGGDKKTEKAKMGLSDARILILFITIGLSRNV